ncbi:unnamed protein product [Spirodela intermedia]|uniref:Methyltransferase domain-containing protein n=1 Tax=Spirodela intermedia TaxID=51605 RepID=A0A7I8JHX0_SPIIN|nr:unnamed protein product [Spirodela intermedia]CAA6669521.1 unnamed protein product [Spirodela intermedia]
MAAVALAWAPLPGIGRRYLATADANSIGPRGRRVVALAARTGLADGLRKGIAEFYDESSGVWESIWGDHMHHGFYEPGATASIADHRAAQIRMVEEALRFAGVSDDPLRKPKNIVDVGCGIGGSSRYLARKYGQNAGHHSEPRPGQPSSVPRRRGGLGNKVSFQVADALEQPFPDGQFDLVCPWRAASTCPTKPSELARVAAPGGIIIIVTWCHRDLLPSENSLTPDEVKLVGLSLRGLLSPGVVLRRRLRIKSADWSANVAPFWPAVIQSALTLQGFVSLLRSGWKTIRGALVMPLMIEGFNKNLIKFAVITCRKPGGVDQ